MMHFSLIANGITQVIQQPIKVCRQQDHHRVASAPNVFYPGRWTKLRLRTHSDAPAFLSISAIWRPSSSWAMNDLPLMPVIPDCWILNLSDAKYDPKCFTKQLLQYCYLMTGESFILIQTDTTHFTWLTPMSDDCQPESMHHSCWLLRQTPHRGM